MENQKKMNNPVVTSRIVCTQSLTINLGNYNSAKVEFSIEKIINDENTDIEKVKADAWNECMQEVNNQIGNIQDYVNNARR